MKDPDHGRWSWRKGREFKRAWGEGGSPGLGSATQPCPTESSHQGRASREAQGFLPRGCPRWLPPTLSLVSVPAPAASLSLCLRVMLGHPEHCGCCRPCSYLTPAGGARGWLSVSHPVALFSQRALVELLWVSILPAPSQTPIC